MDAGEGLQRAGFGLATGDSSCGRGWLWLDPAMVGAANAAGLSAVTGAIAEGLAADFLLVNLDRPELALSLLPPLPLSVDGSATMTRHSAALVVKA